MLLGLAAALVATICFGFGSVQQARGARGVPSDDRIRIGLATGLVRSRPFLLGTGLDVVGFALSVVALRTLPIFVVQAVTNASLAVTAVAAMWTFGTRLRGLDITGIVAVCVGLTLLAMGSGEEGHTKVGTAFGLALLATALLTVVCCWPLARRRGNAVAAVLGVLAGTAFGVVSLAVRVLGDFTPAGLLTNPATYALMVGGLGGYLCYALGLQRGSVTAVTAAGTVGETFIPGLIGVAVLGDQARDGFTWIALAGFLGTVGGTFLLSRFGDIGAEQPQGAADGAPAEGGGPEVAARSGGGQR